MTTPTQFNPIQERLVEIIQKKTQNLDPAFFRIVVSYFFCQVASMMRTHIVLPGEEVIPVNMYVIDLANSGSGKGHSIRLMETRVMNGFRNEFLDNTFPALAETTMAIIGNRRAIKNGKDPDKETLLVKSEFDLCGPLFFSFDSATAAAIKQMRSKLQMGGAGSMNLVIDEIGSNLLGNTEALNAFLELFDVGQIKPKLVKHTKENLRTEDLNDPTPTNMLLFGTPARLLNGTKTEDEFIAFLDTGYARRCFFGYSRHKVQPTEQTPEELLASLSDSSDADYLVQLSNRFTLCASPTQFNTKLQMDDDVQIAFIAYRQYCQTRANYISDYQEAKQAEMAHRWWKCVKLAGAYAFIDSSVYLKMEHWEQAVALTEHSGMAFQNILKRDKSYARLAKFIAGSDDLLTQADLLEELPLYRGTKTEKEEMMNMAVSWGYKNGIVIKRERDGSGIEFFSGEAMKETDLNKMIVSFSEEITHGYLNKRVPFDQLHTLVAAANFHWIAHHVENAHRKDENIIPGCNLAVIDVDDSVDLDTAKLLIEDFKYIIHVTKRHTSDNHRFRLIIPLSHEVELNSRDYKEFMTNIYNWLPFECDRQTNDRPRKWLTNKGYFCYNEGELLDALQFIPKTKKAEEQEKRYIIQGNLDAIERWFVNSMEEGNRNNQMRNYAFYLVDTGMELGAITNMVLALNTKLAVPLPDGELQNTVITSVSKKIHERDTRGK